MEAVFVSSILRSPFYSVHSGSPPDHLPHSSHQPLFPYRAEEHWRTSYSSNHNNTLSCLVLLKWLPAHCLKHTYRQNVFPFRIIHLCSDIHKAEAEDGAIGLSWKAGFVSTVSDAVVCSLLLESLYRQKKESGALKQAAPSPFCPANPTMTPWIFYPAAKSFKNTHSHARAKTSCALTF